MILNHGFYHMAVPNVIETLIRTNTEPFNKTLLTNKKLERHIKKRIEQEKLHRMQENIYRQEFAKGLPGYPKVRAASSEYFLQKEIRQLCKGDLTVIVNACFMTRYHKQVFYYNEPKY